ncbi:MAG: HAD family hydrolase [Caldisericia bacterium]|nr:HAD family hydrolase [Caldisericia bacterium]
MKKKNFEVISLDIFRTLVDLDSRASIIFKKVMGKNGTKSEIRKFWLEVGRVYRKELTKVLKSGKYEGFYPLFLKEMVHFKKMYNLPLDVEEYADIIIEEENLSPFFKDAIPMIELLMLKYKVCITSDTDPEMITNILPNIPAKKLFLSCDFNTYKEDPKNGLFKAVVDFYNIEPSKILHIGDSYSDIIGAKRAGMQACWLNRYKPLLMWKHKDVKPDFTIKNLYQLKRFLLI